MKFTYLNRKFEINILKLKKKITKIFKYHFWHKFFKHYYNFFINIISNTITQSVLIV